MLRQPLIRSRDGQRHRRRGRSLLGRSEPEGALSRRLHWRLALRRKVLLSSSSAPWPRPRCLPRRDCSDAPGRSLPSVADRSPLSSHPYARVEDRAAAIAAGYQRHAAKPIERAAVVEAVALSRTDKATFRRLVHVQPAGNRAVSSCGSASFPNKWIRSRWRIDPCCAVTRRFETRRAAERCWAGAPAGNRVRARHFRPHAQLPDRRLRQASDPPRRSEHPTVSRGSG